MKKLILLFLIILNIATVLAQKQNITFNHLTTDDGLSQFSVNSLYVDEQGVLWIGTREGLNRYNGSDIKTFKLQKNNPNSLFCNTVLRITGDQQGKVFLLCTEGVAEFDLTRRNLQHFCKGTSPVFTSINVSLSEKKTKYTYTTKRHGISTFPIIWRAKTSLFPAFTSTMKVVCGWEPITVGSTN